ncbi:MULTISPECIES: AAA family ATPase [Gordonibacter]|uniref:Chromosome partitioning protein ParA n=1 Tax=Gordonibacter faecis TaxID=3047475 RepID=A0ABT7DL60_9ACTN|nr:MULTISPECIES: chromosome partitioning protein ParA [unclassified Gordonibacter]MDJ1650264.1 chromosome partitioning protein ParA [Gordonibacter sp. KGMB12511]
MAPIMLCADAESMRRPELIGLAGENLAAQDWLRLFATGQDARRYLRNEYAVEEVWVAGCEDVEPINLAAALKRDRADVRVCLLAFQNTGSLMSRASAAGVDASLTGQAFAERYAAAKRRHAGGVAGTGGAGGVAGQGAAGGASVMPPVAERGWPGSAYSAVGEPRTAVRGWPEGAPGGRDARAVAGAGAPVNAGPAAYGAGGAVAAPAAVGATSGKPGFLLPVVSGSGGAGKSTVAALAALFAQGLGYRTLLLDFDLQFGDMRDLLGRPDAPGIDEVLASPARLERLEPEGLTPALLGAPRHLEDAEAVVHDAPALLDELLRRFDVVVANTGASWEEQHALLLERSSKALFLVDQRPSSLRACRHALDLCARCGIATGPFVFAANRCAKGALLTSLDVSCALQGAHAVELRDGGREVEEVVGAGQPLDLVAAKNELCTSLEHVLVDILPDCEGRVLRLAEPRSAKPERRLMRGRRRGRGAVPCPC